VAATTTKGYTPLAVASQNGHVAVVHLLIDKGADVLESDNKGVTPLYVASQQGHGATVRLLLDKGADVSATTYDTTALEVAEGDEAVVRLLREAGAV
jgi:ankyrin repeat protein